MRRFGNLQAGGAGRVPGLCVRLHQGGRGHEPGACVVAGIVHLLALWGAHAHFAGPLIAAGGCWLWPPQRHHLILSAMGFECKGAAQGLPVSGVPCANSPQAALQLDHPVRLPPCAAQPPLLAELRRAHSPQAEGATSRGLSFCTWTLVTLKPEVQVITDTLRDGRRAARPCTIAHLL
jgi:hypothetical protein